MSGQTRIGVDIGGTFTDIVVIRDGQIEVSKTPSTPAHPNEGVLNGLRAAVANGSFEISDVGFLAHGTTVATNAVLEKEWAETALITTKGFRDALEIGRQARPDLYDFDAEKPAPIVERDRRYEVEERLNERGEVVKPLDEASVREVAASIDDEVESVAISLLFSFENDAHERDVRTILEEEGVDTSVSLSSRALPEIREYERTLATALNAGLKPIMDQYVGDLTAEIGELGIPAELKIMQSNGGLITAEVARDRPINTLLSGPAAGVQGAAYIADTMGVSDIITMDMGGTSCDVSLVKGGEPITSTEVAVGDYPVGVPMIDVHTIGAGGDSIGWIDAGDALRVGPRSAGADPGPVCYGRGGTEPTITDAHLLLGRIDPATFGHDFNVDAHAVREAVASRLGEPLGMGVEAAAQGMLDVANANMERALRVVSVERGHDPRDFSLVAYGGAGPLHACKLAEELDIPRVVVPQTAGVLSALGLLISDVTYDYSVTRVRSWSELNPGDLTSQFESFESRGRDRLSSEGIDRHDQGSERSLDVRYAGQSFDLSVSVPDEPLDEAVLETVADRFHDRHEQRYGYASPDEPLELVTIRVRARGRVEEPELSAHDRPGRLDDAIREEREVVYDGTPHTTRVYARERLPRDVEFSGPAVVEGEESTVVVHPDQAVSTDEYGNLIVETT